jgi:hypothetical protein
MQALQVAAATMCALVLRYDVIVCRHTSGPTRGMMPRPQGCLRAVAAETSATTRGLTRFFPAQRLSPVSGHVTFSLGADSLMHVQPTPPPSPHTQSSQACLRLQVCTYLVCSRSSAAVCHMVMHCLRVSARVARVSTVHNGVDIALYSVCDRQAGAQTIACLPRWACSAVIAFCGVPMLSISCNFCNVTWPAQWGCCAGHLTWHAVASVTASPPKLCVFLKCCFDESRDAQTGRGCSCRTVTMVV